MLGIKDIRRLVTRWQASRDASLALDALLQIPAEDAPLVERNQWVIELLYWLRSKDKKGINNDSLSHPEHVRLKGLLQLLEQKPDAKLAIAKLLRSVLRDNDALSLLCDTGVVSKPTFWSEMFERIRQRFIAAPPNQPELSVLFSLGFVGSKDADWVYTLDQQTLLNLQALFHYQEEPQGQYRIYQDIADAIHILISYVEAAGLSYSVRTRIREASGQGSAFYLLRDLAKDLLSDASRIASPSFNSTLAELKAVIDRCYIACDDVYAHLDENGVAVDTVFQVETMRLRLARIELLLNTWMYRDQAQNYSHLSADLILTVQGRRSVRRLAEQSLALLSRKVVERSAETGEHYIADTRRTYLAMFKKSLGGGAVIGGTVYLKFLIASLGMVRFFENLFLALNYATSFLIIQFASFTLATKQPAMTAPALAQLLDDVDQDPGLERFVDRTIALVRSQTASILGNVLMVVPVAIVIQVAIILLIQKPSISDTKAMSVLATVSPFSGIWIYAAFTGLLLWLSSLIAGLVDNWFVLHRIQDVIRYNRRLGIVFGSLRAERWALWWKENVAVVAANVSLAFLLIYGPTFLGFLGIGMEIRHVTLSAGAFAAASIALGWKVFAMGAFWLGILGIFLIGFINVIVSFWFAFQMALRSRDLPALDRKRLYTAVWKRVKAQPRSLFIPSK